MKIYFQKVRVKYYKIAIYFFGLSFLMISGCRSKTPDPSSVDETTISQNESDTLSQDSVSDNTKTTIISDTSKKVATPKKVSPQKIFDDQNQPEYGVRYQEYKEQTEPLPAKPSESPVMNPAAAYGTNINDYRLNTPTTVQPNE